MDGMALCLDDVTEAIVKQPSKIYIHLKIKASLHRKAFASGAV